MNNHLCIGGPLDGEFHNESIKDRTTFVTPERRPAIAVDHRGLVQPQPIKLIQYSLDVLRFVENGQIKEVHFWRPEDQTPYRTMLRLLERYQQKEAAHRCQ